MGMLVCFIINLHKRILFNYLLNGKKEVLFNTIVKQYKILHC